MYCPRCGSKVNDDMLFCPKCGNDLGNINNIGKTDNTEKTSKIRKNRGVIKVFIITIVVIAMAIGGYFTFLQMQHSKRAQNIMNQLVGKNFEHSYYIDSNRIYVKWLSFPESGICRTECYDGWTDISEDNTQECTIRISFDDEIALCVGENSVYQVFLDEDESILELVDAENIDSYYEFNREYIDLSDMIGVMKAYQEEAETEAREEAEQAAMKEEALNLFTEMTFWPDTIHTFNTLIPTIFADYTLTCEPYETGNDDESIFIITVSGPYYFNKVDLPTLTRQGELVCRVTMNPEESSVEIIKDDGIIDAMEVYVILSMYSGF